MKRKKALEGRSIRLNSGPSCKSFREISFALFTEKQMELHQDLKTSFQMTKVTEYSKERK